MTRISQPLATELEITELADREMKKPGGGQALLIEQPTVNGQVSPHPLAINTMGSAKRMAMALGAESVDAAAAELGSLIQAKPPTGIRETIALLGQALTLRHAKPKRVKTGPCKEVVHRLDAPAARTEPWPSAPDILEAGRTLSLARRGPVRTPGPTRRCSTCRSSNVGRSTAGVSSRCPALSPATLTPATATSACIACRFTTTRPSACIGNCKKSPRATAAATTKPASGCRWPSSSAATRCFRFAPPRRCLTASTNFCSPATSAASRSRW